MLSNVVVTVVIADLFYLPAPPSPMLSQYRNLYVSSGAYLQAQPVQV